MKEKLKMSSVISSVVVMLLILFVLLGFYYGWFLPAKPSVVVDISGNTTNILGFAYARYPGTMQCLACENFYVKVFVYKDDVLICESEESTISLGGVRLPIQCNNNLELFEGELVKVIAEGSVTPAWQESIKSRDEKLLNLTFANKK
ncbi:hypothetical protein HYW74_00900 [Candidatus Pacearchaeota archaeon]|nr:hypothetical protein [Candidatus Pacearchaeota archaeon]